MLAFMPRASSLPQLHTQPSRLAEKMSLALLPSTSQHSCNQQPCQDAFHTLPSPSKRPKLSLNTTNVPQGSTSLRLDTLSATSPTTVNTFQNRQNVRSINAGATPRRPTLTPLTTTNIETSSIYSATLSQTPLSITSNIIEEGVSAALATASPINTLNSSPSGAPYKLPFNATSILTNGPIPRQPSPPTSSFSQTLPPFPAPKKVGFRAPLTEDIKTTKFVLSHADIVESPLRLSACQPPSANMSEPVQEDGKMECSSTQSGSKRDSFDLEPNESCPATPVAGRAKRQKWVWTIESSRPAGVEGEVQ